MELHNLISRLMTVYSLGPDSANAAALYAGLTGRAHIKRNRVSELTVGANDVLVTLCANLTPELMYRMFILASGGCPGLICAPAEGELLEACIPACAVFNHYGPTEATVGVAMYPVNTKRGTAENLKARGYRTVPIGTVLGDNELRVVDEQLKPCVEGHIGELVVSGPSLAEGYLGSTDQSSLRFIEANWSSYGVAYRTGDLARVCPTGEIELYGRMDRQYKIRGYRVEAAGVEEELRAHLGVFDAFVDYRDQGEFGMALTAWVHADDGVDDATLRGFLGEKLPDPMVPSKIIVMKALPRTPNGKIDSTALPDLHSILPTGRDMLHRGWGSSCLCPDTRFASRCGTWQFLPPWGALLGCFASNLTLTKGLWVRS